MLLRIIILSLVVFLLLRVVKGFLASRQRPAEPDLHTPRSVNEWADPSEPEVLLPEQDLAQANSYWQKKIQDAYRQGYKDGLDDGKGKGEGRL